MSKPLLKIAGWAYFIVFQLIALACFIVGIVVLIPMAYFRLWIERPSLYFPGRTVTAWRGGWITFILSNEEDGVTGAAFYQARYLNPRVCAYLWSAWRNSANNLRFVFRWKGGPFWRWQNAKHTLYAQAGWYPNGFPVLSAGRM